MKKENVIKINYLLAGGEEYVAFYDFAGRRSLLTTDAGRTQSYTYDALGNITGLVDGNGNRTAYTTDLWGRVTVLSLPDGTKEQYGYDHAGNMTTATDGNGNTVTYQYNCINRMSQRTDVSGATEYFSYDMEGRLSEHTDRNGSRTLYRYNMYGSPVLHEAADTGLTESWEYDALGRLKSATAGGMRYEYAYYGNGRLREKKASGRTLLAYAYDLDGNKISRKDLTGKETAYSYNRNGQMTSVSENGRILAAYTYHADGNVEKLTVGNSLTTQYSYDTDRNLTGLRTVDGTNILADNTYDYDANANRIGKHSIEGLTRYSYDANNRLVEVQYPNILGEQPHFEQLSYDMAGNRVGRVTEHVSEQYHYDNCNRLTQLQRSYTDLSKSAETVSYSYDKQGNMLSDGKNTYGYDSFNRVEQVTTADGNTQKNHYDAEGLRHEMEENGALVKFLFNENREVEVEEESNGNIIRYIRGLGIICSDSESAKTYYHYVSDEHGSITHVTDAETGEVLNHYTYDAFGNTMECDEKVHNRFRYNGEQYDPLTSQYYLRARFYNPVIARFTQEDTYYGDGLNLYQYCANNPIAYVDPSGHNICQTQRDVYHDKCEAYMREHGLSDYSQIPKNEKTRMFKEMRTELGKTSDSKYKGSGTGPESNGSRLYTDPVTGQKYYYSDSKGNVFDLASDYLQGQKKVIAGDPLMYSMNNKKGGTIVVSTDAIDLYSFKNTLDYYSNQRKKIVILSGSHGMETGESALGVNRKRNPNTDLNSRLCAERDFYDQDVTTASAYKRIKVYDITKLSEHKFNKILNSDKVVICAWCFSERSTDIINAIR